MRVGYISRSGDCIPPGTAEAIYPNSRPGSPVAQRAPSGERGKGPHQNGPTRTRYPLLQKDAAPRGISVLNFNQRQQPCSYRTPDQRSCPLFISLPLCPSPLCKDCVIPIPSCSQMVTEACVSYCRCQFLPVLHLKFWSLRCILFSCDFLGLDTGSSPGPGRSHMPQSN